MGGGGVGFTALDVAGAVGATGADEVGPGDTVPGVIGATVPGVTGAVLVPVVVGRGSVISPSSASPHATNSGRTSKLSERGRERCSCMASKIV